MCEIIKKAVGRVYLSSSRCIYENLAFEEFLFRKYDIEKDGDVMFIWRYTLKNLYSFYVLAINQQ